MSTKLKVNHLNYSYHSKNGETKALSDLTFHVIEGEFLAIVGPSGCGKSTLLSLLCGILEPDSGAILMDDSPLKANPRSIGYMLQKDHLLEWRTILDNIALGLEIQNKNTKNYKSRILDMLDTYGLSGFDSSSPSSLSGGMRQRVALIRTLICDPEILLLDEPFSALDYQTRLSVCDDISSIIKETKKTAILITHDLAEAISVADRIIVLTNRPAKVKATLSLEFSKEMITSLERRNSTEFSCYFNQLWSLLQEQ